MKKVSHTGAKLQIQNNPPGWGTRLAGVLELESSQPAAGAVPGRAAAAALHRAQGTAHRGQEDPNSGKHLNLCLLRSLFKTAYKHVLKSP